jgi:predicted DCC family thiol-disulfide oxidoreductase YuxK
MSELLRDKKIILFDGVCNLCSAFFRFVYLYDYKAVFHFAWIQSEAAEKLLEILNLPTEDFTTIVYLEDGQPYFKSDAFLKIVKHLKFPWPLFRVGIIFPRFIRDWIYDLVARNRYKWFGKKDQCIIPEGDLQDRFL